MLQPAGDKAQNGGDDGEHSSYQLDEHHQGERRHQSQQGQAHEQGHPAEGPGQHVKHEITSQDEIPDHDDTDCHGEKQANHNTHRQRERRPQGQHELEHRLDAGNEAQE